MRSDGLRIGADLEHKEVAAVTRRKQQSQQPSAPGSAQGQPVTPSTAPPPEDKPETDETEEIPIGMPISPEELRRRKALAERPQAPPESAAGEPGTQPAPDAEEDKPES
jgi:hypothetical protein